MTAGGEIIYNRLAGRVGNKIRLNATFLRNGVPADPYAIRMVRIYKKSVEDVNLVAEIPFPPPDSTEYPSPATKLTEGPCGNDGHYELIFDVPCDFPSPDVFFDVWYFIPDLNCLEENATEFDIDDESLWVSKCNKFWLFPDGWYVDDRLITPRLGFEPLDVHFRQGEVRYLEVGMMPLPLYDYDYNKIAPMIPYLRPSISIFTRNCEVVVDDEEMEMGLRQGSFRTNPFVAKYLLDTNNFLKNTYEYQVTVKMPDCQTIVSPKYTFTVS